jgi:hypothetical protein
MKKYLAVALGILTAIGGFVDIGDLVTNAVGRSPLRVVAGLGRGDRLRRHLRLRRDGRRVAAVSGRATFDLVRERLGPRVGLLNLIGRWP